MACKVVRRVERGEQCKSLHTNMKKRVKFQKPFVQQGGGLPKRRTTGSASARGLARQIPHGAPKEKKKQSTAERDRAKENKNCSNPPEQRNERTKGEKSDSSQNRRKNAIEGKASRGRGEEKSAKRLVPPFEFQNGPRKAKKKRDEPDCRMMQRAGREKGLRNTVGSAWGHRGLAEMRSDFTQK